MGSPLALPLEKRLWASLLFATAVWLCPVWSGPTPVASALLWSGVCLGFWVLLAALAPVTAAPRPRLDLPLALLLSTLGAVVLLRSSNLANALAANSCLLAIGLSAHLARTLAAQGKSDVIAWSLLCAGLINSLLALAQYPGWTAERQGTAFGFLRQRNNMASLCVMAWAAAHYLCYVHKLTVRWALAASAVLMTALAATASRTGLLQLGLLGCLLGGGLLFYWRKCYGYGRSRAANSARSLRARSLVLLCFSAIVCYTLAAWALPLVSGSGETVLLRVMGTASSTESGLQFQDSRKLLWSNTWALIEQHPFWGVGWRELAYSLHMTDFGSAARFGSQADNAHNLPLQFAAELGLPFAALWLCAVAGYLLCKAYAAWPARHGLPQATALLGWSVLLVLGIHSLLEYPLWYGPFQIALGLALGLIASTDGLQRIATKNTPSISTLLGTGLLLFCTYAAFDYHRVSQLFVAAEQRSAFYQGNTLEKVQGSWLFASQVRFSKLLTTPVTDANAAQMWQLGQQVIHFSPEPRVFKVLIAAGMHLEPNDAVIAAQVVILKRQLAIIER